MVTPVEACLELDLEVPLVLTRVPTVNGFALEAGRAGGPVKYQLYTVGAALYLAYRSTPERDWGTPIRLAASITPVVAGYPDLARFARSFFSVGV